jgi:hypothetical protein
MKFIKVDSATKLIRTNGAWLVIILWPQCAKREADKYKRPQNRRQRIRIVHRPLRLIFEHEKTCRLQISYMPPSSSVQQRTGSNKVTAKPRTLPQ